MKAKPTVRAQLTQARAALRITRSAIRALPGLMARETVPEGPPRFIALIVQPRGGFGAIHALDSVGDVWEYILDREGQVTKAAYWKKLTMERR